MSKVVLNVMAGVAGLVASAGGWPQTAEYMEFRAPAGVQGCYGFTPFAVSADGTVLAGRVLRGSSCGTLDTAVAARWTLSEGITELGVLHGHATPFPQSVATAVNANGSVIVGHSRVADRNSFPDRAFRWTRETGMVALPLLNGGLRSDAQGVNADGSVVVGTAQDGRDMRYRAVRWTQETGIASLGAINGGDFSQAYAVNAEGNVVVGYSRDGQLTTPYGRAFRWTPSTGMVSLGTLPGDRESYAFAVNADGSVVAGQSIREAARLTSRAFRWTHGGGIEDLGALPAWSFTRATGINADGNVIVGSAYDGSGGGAAFRWTRQKGMQTVQEWLRENGVTGVAADGATATNADGSVVVGHTDERGWIARVAAVGTGFITFPEVEQSLSSAATAGAMILNSLSTVLNGAHSRPLSRRVAAGNKAFWVTGDVGRDDHGSRSGNFGIAEVGIGYNFGPAQVNASLGGSKERQKLPVGGRAESDGAYVMAEALVQTFANLTTTLGAYVGRGEADIRRGYMNGGMPDASSSSPDVAIYGFRARVDWEKLASVAGMTVSPYVDLTRSRAKLEGYTESGGGFPARFDAREETATELRLGLTALWPLSPRVQLVSIVEAAHRFEKSGARTTGNLVGLFSFDLPGSRYDRDWMRVAAGVDAAARAGTISLMLNATNRGAVPTYWVSASWQLTF